MEFNRYRRKRPKVDASIFDSALSHTRRSNASGKKEENSVVALRSLLNVSVKFKFKMVSFNLIIYPEKIGLVIFFRLLLTF